MAVHHERHVGGPLYGQSRLECTQFRQALDESEVRQQANLQLRINEVTRDFDLQRRSDLVQVEQGFGRLDSKNREMQNAIRQVSLSVPQQ